MKLQQFFPLLFVASTTSVENSGLLAQILPAFTTETGITVHVLAQGTGQALETAARNDADLVLVHDPEAEQKFIAAGHGIDRRQIAWNDFIVVGPRAEPAHIAGTHDAVEALKAISGAQAPFVSRGDKSGTDALEHRLWRVAGIDPAKAGGGSWYRDIGGGMGAALNAAQAMNANTISDRGTWLSFANKGDLAVVVEGDSRLLNRYDVILLNPAKHPVPKQAWAARFAQWLVSARRTSGDRRIQSPWRTTVLPFGGGSKVGMIGLDLVLLGTLLFASVVLYAASPVPRPSSPRWRSSVCRRQRCGRLHWRSTFSLLRSQPGASIGRVTPHGALAAIIALQLAIVLMIGVLACVA